MRVSNRDGGGLILGLDPMEAAVLLTLPERLAEVLTDPDFTDAAVRRLYPPGHRELADEAEFRAMVGADLQAAKLERVDIFKQSLLDATRKRNRLTVELEPEKLEYWLGFTNDMRLLLGTELEIDEDWEPDENMGSDEALYEFLTWLQSMLIHAESDGE